MAFTVVMLTGVMLFPTPNLDPVMILLVFYPVIVNTAITGSIAFDMLRGMCRDRRWLATKYAMPARMWRHGSTGKDVV